MNSIERLTELLDELISFEAEKFYFAMNALRLKNLYSCHECLKVEKPIFFVWTEEFADSFKDVGLEEAEKLGNAEERLTNLSLIDKFEMSMPSLIGYEAGKLDKAEKLKDHLKAEESCLTEVEEPGLIKVTEPDSKVEEPGHT
ncbi:unnamed protein product [Ilex paraguariensis]|uniref:Uncharacterized protein n=1 Tax=Ilex paraguariensis TaxID=185542 RepID=A0ABC8QUT3_9AQUA